MRVKFICKWEIETREKIILTSPASHITLSALSTATSCCGFVTSGHGLGNCLSDGGPGNDSSGISESHRFGDWRSDSENSEGYKNDGEGLHCEGTFRDL
jgi:hypothetical protein